LAVPEALKDAESCISIQPDYVKGYLRKGNALFFLKEYRRSIEAYQKGLQYDPNNKEITQGLQRAIQKINTMEEDESGK